MWKKIGLAICASGMMGCTQGVRSPASTSTSSSAVILSDLTVVSYDTSVATLNIRGALHLDSVTELNTVKFYMNSSCSGQPAGQGIENDFTGSGIEIRLSSTVA